MDQFLIKPSVLNDCSPDATEAGEKGSQGNVNLRLQLLFHFFINKIKHLKS